MHFTKKLFFILCIVFIFTTVVFSIYIPETRTTTAGVRATTTYNYPRMVQMFTTRIRVRQRCNLMDCPRLYN